MLSNLKTVTTRKYNSLVIRQEIDGNGGTYDFLYVTSDNGDLHHQPYCYTRNLGILMATHLREIHTFIGNNHGVNNRN